MGDDQHDSEMQDFRLRGYHGIPDSSKLQAMSYIQLSEIFQSCEKNSTKFHVIERELKKHLAKDQAAINRKNMIIGACIGGIFGLTGVFLGALIKESPPVQRVAPAGTVQQKSNSNLPAKPPVASLPLSAPSIKQSSNSPAPIQNNPQPTKPHP